MKKLPTIAATMTAFPHSIDQDAPLADARAMMKSLGIRHLPVTESGKLASIISERDLHWTDAPFASGVDTGELLVRDLCSERIVVVDIHDSLMHCLQLMVGRHIGSVLVEKGGKLAGIITHTDICRKFAEVLEGMTPVTGGDDAA